MKELDQTTRERIEKEAEEHASTWKGNYYSPAKLAYIAGATLWAEQFIELQQEVKKYVFWHDKFFNDTIVGQPPSLQPLRDLISELKDKSESRIES